MPAGCRRRVWVLTCLQRESACLTYDVFICPWSVRVDVLHICHISLFSRCPNNFHIINYVNWLSKMLQFRISLELKYLLVGQGAKIRISSIHIQQKSIYFNFLRKCLGIAPSLHNCHIHLCFPYRPLGKKCYTA